MHATVLVIRVMGVVRGVANQNTYTSMSDDVSSLSFIRFANRLIAHVATLIVYTQHADEDSKS